MRNASWQTDFRHRVPYKKGDNLEYVLVFSGNFPRGIAINVSTIKNFLDIERMEWDEKEILEKDLSNLRTENSSLLKIIGKAKNTSTESGIPKPEVTVKEEIATEEKPEIEKSVQIPQAEPIGSTVDATRYNSNINNLIVFRGENIESVEFVNIGEKRIRPAYASGTLFVQVDKDTFTTGGYFVFFTLKNGRIFPSDHRIFFEHSSSAINIANITPKTLRNSEESFIVIQGNGFDKIVSVQLSNNLILKNAEFKIINNRVAGVKIPKGLPPGEYYFNIMDTATIHELKNMRFTITNQ